MASMRPKTKGNARKRGSNSTLWLTRPHSVRLAPIPLGTNCMNVIDTNIWIYRHDVRDPQKQLVAKNLISSIGPLVLPWQVGCDFMAGSRKLAPLGFDEAKAWAALGQMQAMATVVLM